MDTTVKIFGIMMVSAISLAGCGDEDPKPPGAANGDGSTAPAPAGCDVDFRDLASAPAVSFRNDIMHMFGLSCTQAACHGTGATQPQAELLLGPPCGSFDSATMQCSFATTPLTDDLVTQVWTNLVGVAAVTVNSPIVLRVAPGDPMGSFLIHKTAGTHENQGYMCTPQVTTVDTPCGNAMPPLGQPLCLLPNGQTRFDKLAKWILDDAQND